MEPIEVSTAMMRKLRVCDQTGELEEEVVLSGLSNSGERGEFINHVIILDLTSSTS